MKAIVKKDTVTSINATRVGSPTINGFVVNNFNASNYFRITGGSLVSASNLNSFEVCCKVKTPSTFADAGRIINPTNGADSTTAPFIQVTAGNSALIWYNGSTYFNAIAISGAKANTDYWLKWIYDGSTIKSYNSTNGVDYNLNAEIAPPYKPFFNSNEFSIGCRSFDSAHVCVWNGSIDFSKLTIKLNGSLWLSGTKTELIDKVYAVKNNDRVFMAR